MSEPTESDVPADEHLEAGETSAEPGIRFMANPVGWVRENRAKAEILAIAGMAIGGIVCMALATVLIIIGLTRS